MASQAEIKKLTIRVGKYYALGLTSLQISQRLNVGYTRVLNARKRIAQNLEKEAGELWVTFLLQYQNQYREARQMKQRAKGANNLNAEIGATKLLTDLTDKMATYAQKLGLVPEEPQRVAISLEQHANNWEKLFNFQGIQQKDLVNCN